MLTPQQLSAMTPEERLQLFDQLCIGRYGTASYVPQAARELDVAKRTIFGWREKGDVPISAVAAMFAWANASDLKERQAVDYADLIEQLSAAGKHFRAATAALTRIMNRNPALTDGASSAASEPRGDDVSGQSPGSCMPTKTQAEA